MSNTGSDKKEPAVENRAYPYLKIHQLMNSELHECIHIKHDLMEHIEEEFAEGSDYDRAALIIQAVPSEPPEFREGHDSTMS